MKASAKEKNQLSRVQKIVYDFVRYFSDVRDHAIGVHEVLSLEEVVRGREDAYRQAREVLRVAREKQERFIKYQKDIANLHSKLTTSDETFKEHLYDRIRRAEAERPFSASYDPLSTDAAAKDSVGTQENLIVLEHC
jgi:molybdopterin converting factor small subunit